MSENKGKAAVIIVNWNGLRFLRDCFTALKNQTYKDFDIYFVDNGSLDGSVEYVEENFNKVKIIKNKKNFGFAGGNNIGIREALKDKTIEYIVLINNDTIVEPEWLEALINEVDIQKKVEMISSMALFTDGNVQSIGLKLEKDLIGNDIGGLSLGYGEDPKKFKTKQEIFCPSGVSALSTRRLIEDIGLFDTTFFAYSEDLDLGFRAYNKGYRAVFTPESRLIHLHSQSSGGRASPLKSYLIKRNSYFVAIKNFPLIDLILYPYWEMKWNITSTFNKNQESSSNVLKEKIGFIGILKIMLKVYSSVFVLFPLMFIKRYKKQKF